MGRPIRKLHLTMILGSSIDNVTQLHCAEHQGCSVDIKTGLNVSASTSLISVKEKVTVEVQ